MPFASVTYLVLICDSSAACSARRDDELGVDRIKGLMFAGRGFWDEVEATLDNGGRRGRGRDVEEGVRERGGVRGERVAGGGLRGSWSEEMVAEGERGSCFEGSSWGGVESSDARGCLSWGWPAGVSEVALSLESPRLRVDADVEVGRRSPRLTFSSINRSPTFRPKLLSATRLPLPEVLLLPLRLRLAFSWPDMILALGGGCSIQRVSQRWVGCVLTTGGCRSLTAGLRAT